MVKITNLDKVEAMADTCGFIKELAHEPDVSLAYALITGTARSHKHEVMQEIYYVLKGQGTLVVGDERYSVKPGDTAVIPKNTYHHLEKEGDADLEVLVVTSPMYDPDDVLEED
ncbi:cupin domain-containing protein [Thermoproteota archaeon]